MRTIYLDCGMGAAGDMLMAALLELCPEKKEEFLEKMNHLGIPGLQVQAQEAEKCGIVGTHMEVKVFGEEEESEDVYGCGADGGAHPNPDVHTDTHAHAHADTHTDTDTHAHAQADTHADTDTHTHAHLDTHTDTDTHTHIHIDTHTHSQPHPHPHFHADMAGIAHRISHLDLPDQVKKDMEAVYGLIAEAEAAAHGKPVDQIHFHEVGTADAIADIAGVCLLMDLLKPDRILASPVHVGSGQVRCAHGILPIPAPATAHILKGIPIYGGQVQGELCTPTGAALLKHFVTDFGEMPVMTADRIGYGMGKKDFDRANCVRALMGETGAAGDKIVELSCNLDDMTAEAMGYAQEILFEAGALEVYTTAVGMKKNRPGTLLSCMCREGDRETMIRLIFKYTTTLGIREQISRRYTLTRREERLDTPFGAVNQKTSSGYGVTRSKLEYEDLARIARETGLSLGEVKEKIGLSKR